jgi:flavin reductase (DIM6/NTAB) family NADH-FMN oxidoreductase RutF
MFLDELNKAFRSGGAFLLVDKNPMTIGWGMLGTMWYQDVMTIMVRPSRYTYKLLEKNKRFSVSVPKVAEFKEELAFCGSKSGRDVDKLKECKLELMDGKNKGIKIIKNCSIYYECEIVHECMMDKTTVKDESVLKYYPEQKNFHKFYHAKILNCYKI